VRNYQARNFMRAMAVGDRGFFFHSQTERAVVGIVEVCAPSAQDPSTDDPAWDCVTIRAVAPMQQAVSLVAIKSNDSLADMVLVRNSRLSVQPVMRDEWNAVCRMGGADTYTL
jgi:predicted RNA-binding protein with PUA-like domain